MSTTVPSNGHTLAEADDDDPIARYLDIIARLRELLLAAQQYDAVVEELMPEEPRPRRRRYANPVDLALLKSLKPLRTHQADRIETAIESVEDNLEQAREAVQEETERELEEIESRARILRQRLRNSGMSDAEAREENPA